jgi:succinate dehydrogenase / fumarate reductase flavoprotein subunit
MQGLADGYYVIPYTLGPWLAPMLNTEPLPTDHGAFRAAEQEVSDRMQRLLSINGTRSVDWFHRELGKIMIEQCGMARSAPGLEKALSEIPALREEFYNDVKVLGENESFNQSLERAGRVADFFELAGLMCIDALNREESCGGHFRVEHQTAEGEAQRNDDDYAYVAAWGFSGSDEPTLWREPLDFEYVELTQRSYK